MTTISSATSDFAMRPRGGFRWLARSFAPLAWLADTLAIVLMSLFAGVSYHMAIHAHPGIVENFAAIGLLTAALFGLSVRSRGAYGFEHYLEHKHHLRTIVWGWHVAFLMLFAIGFLTKTSDIFSRGWIILLYAGGFAALALQRALLVELVKRGDTAGLFNTRRALVVGCRDAVEDFLARYDLPANGLVLVGTMALGEERAGDDSNTVPDERLQRAIAEARFLEPDDIYIAVPWSRADLIDRYVNVFMTLPVTLHLAPERILDRFGHMDLRQHRKIPSLGLLDGPLSSPAARFIKRFTDIAAALFGLILLAPLFAVIAALIKCDSKGPAFFVQHRLGFNQKPFRILKFRTMISADNGPVVRQVTDGDARVTPLGRFLRRANLDELPQLLNVLKGDMSLVGPRPHAVAHDQEFERVVARYARRHNVRPGITGWAQINGYRGITDTEEKIRGRLEHDLYYIDNWSLGLDLRILLATVLSKRAYKNAA